MVAYKFQKCGNSINYFDAPKRYKSQTWFDLPVVDST